MKRKNIYILILINYIIFALDMIFDLSFLYLNHQNWQIYQLLTSAFCHADFMHISGNMFFIFFFGRYIEESVSDKQIVIIYLATAISVNIIFLLLFPIIGVSLGASGVVFAFFAIALINKKRKDWQSILEIIIIAPFVLTHIFQELNSINKNDNIGHIAHLIGVLIGPAIFYSIKKYSSR